MQRYWTQVRTSVAGLLMALVVGALVPAHAAAAEPITFYVATGATCIGGYATPEQPVRVRWNGADGHPKLRTTVTSAQNGSFEFCSDELVEFGDMVRANDGFSTHDLIVPQLTLVQNRVLDVYKGRGPAGQYVRLFLTCFVGDGCGAISQKIHVSSAGKWSYSGWTVSTVAYVAVRWRDSAGDSVSTGNYSTALTVRIGSPRVRGAASNGRSATVALHRGTNDLRASFVATASPLNGLFSGKLRNASGSTVKVRVGDRITSDIASDADFIVTNISATADATTDQITGQCAIASDVEIHVYQDGYEQNSGTYATEDDGTFYVDPDSRPTLLFEPGDSILISCSASASGDRLEKFFTAV